jgi:transcriptional regulator with GAF, ATPase, and Fis domain
MTVFFTLSSIFFTRFMIRLIRCPIKSWKLICTKISDINAFFAYPLIRSDNVIGVITLSNLKPYSPSMEEISACRLLAERAAAALEKLDFLMVQDLFLTETAKKADVVFPACSFAEKNKSRK